MPDIIVSPYVVGMTSAPKAARATPESFADRFARLAIEAVERGEHHVVLTVGDYTPNPYGTFQGLVAALAESGWCYLPDAGGRSQAVFEPAE